MTLGDLHTAIISGVHQLVKNTETNTEVPTDLPLKCKNITSVCTSLLLLPYYSPHVRIWNQFS